MRRSFLVFEMLLVAACTGSIASGPASNGPIAPPAGNDPGTPTTTAPPGDPPADPPVVAFPFEPLAARASAAKVKDTLTGLPLDDLELAAIKADPGALRRLIDGWMATPEYAGRMFQWFKTAFQQTQLDPTDIEELLRLGPAKANAADRQKLLTSVQESFARTVMALLDEKRPFTETVTTRRFMLNTPLMVALAFADATPQADLGQSVPAGNWLLAKYGGNTFKVVFTTNKDPITGVDKTIPFEETIDDKSPRFMNFAFAQPDPARYAPCPDPQIETDYRAFFWVYRAMFGGRCQGAPAVPLFSDQDWNTWRMVTIRQPRAGEERTTFWDLPKLRDPLTAELVLDTPRVGFLTTIAFFANWPTNPSNSYRVTANQALIVGLGKSFDDRATTVQVAETSVDSLHVQPGTPCFACHQALDPMRDFYKQSYSITYSQQLGFLDPKSPPLPETGIFNVAGGDVVRGSGIETFARGIAGHPRFATAWTQKLCRLANASTCQDDDPELVRVAQAFAQSGFDWKTLVRELFSSPLVTYAARTKTAESVGVTVSIARRETYCTRLGNRLGYQDLCSLAGASTVPKAAAAALRNLSLGIPGSSYARADEDPATPHDPNLFFVSGVEKMCMTLAPLLVEYGNGWKVVSKEAAFGDFVRLVMGVPPGDELALLLTGILQRHFAAAVAAKQSPVDALRSTFTLACASPLAVSIGL